MSVWVPVVLAGLASYLLRLLPVAWLANRPAPAWMERLGPLVAPVAFAALAGASLAGSAGEGAGTAVPLLVGVAVTGVVARLTGATGRSVLAGMAAVWLLAAVV